MNRRSFLSLVTVGTAGGLSGCLGGNVLGTPSATRSAGLSTAAEVRSVAGVELPVPKSALSRGATKDAIPAITDPAFAADWSGQGSSLAAADEVVGVVRGGTARAYPLRVLNWHEIVNDEFAGPLLVSYCPLCGSAIAAKRTVDGRPTIFGVSGLLWNSDLVMYDRATDSLWSQIAATAIRGPETGERLSLVAASLTTWGTWRGEYPQTQVLLPPPESKVIGGTVTRNYDKDPYANYDDTDRIGIGANETPTGGPRLHPKTQVLGIAHAGVAKAYPLGAVRKAGVVNDRVGDLPVVVTVSNDRQTLVAYVRRIQGEPRQFRSAPGDHLQAAGSRWRVATGRAVDGPHEGTQLQRANQRSPMFWFAWHDFHPDSTVFEAS